MSKSVPQHDAPQAYTTLQVSNGLALSDERARADARVAAAFRAGYRAASGEQWRAGFDAGYAACERDDAAARRALVAELTESPASSASRRLHAAEAYSRRRAARHWDEFTRRAFETPAGMRTPVQAATVRAGRMGSGE